MGALQPKPDARLRLRLLLGLDAPEGSYHKMYVFATVMITKVFGPLCKWWTCVKCLDGLINRKDLVDLQLKLARPSSLLVHRPGAIETPAGTRKPGRRLVAERMSSAATPGSQRREIARRGRGCSVEEEESIE